MEFRHPAVEASYRAWLATEPGTHALGYGTVIIMGWTVLTCNVNWWILLFFGLLILASQTTIVFMYQSNSAQRKVNMWGSLYAFSLVLYFLSRSALAGSADGRREEALALATHLMLRCTFTLYWWLSEGLTVGFAVIPHFPWLVMLLFLSQKWDHTPRAFQTPFTSNGTWIGTGLCAAFGGPNVVGDAVSLAGSSLHGNANGSGGNWNGTCKTAPGVTTAHVGPHMALHVAADLLASLFGMLVKFFHTHNGEALLWFLAVEVSFWVAFARSVRRERRKRQNFLKCVEFPLCEDVSTVSIRPLARQIAVFQALSYSLLFAYHFLC